MSNIIGVGPIEVAEAKANPQGKRWYSTKIGGIWGTTFDMKLGASLRVGDVGEYEFEPRGEFKTLRRFEVKVAGASAQPHAPGTPATASYSDEKDARISRSHAVTAAISLVTPLSKKGDTVDDLLGNVFEVAEQIKVYTTTGKNPLEGSDDPLFAEGEPK